LVYPAFTVLVRKKSIPLDDAGTTAVIGALSFAQIEQFASLHIASPTTDEEKAKATKAIQGLVADALNNADPNAGWTTDRITAEMDPHTFQLLFEGVLEFSMLRVKGEEPAAAAPSASPNS
jgi:hypothetical protein